MQNRIPFLLLIIFASVCLQAQEVFSPYTQIGASGGIDFTRVSFNPRVNQSPLTTLSGGLMVRYVSSAHLGLQGEIVYGKRGWVENMDTLGSYKRQLEVWHVPFQTVIIAGSKTLQFSFLLGPYVTWCKSEKEEITLDTAYYKDYYLNPLSSKWEFGLTVGAGIEIQTRVGTFSIRASFCHSLTNVFPLNETYYFSASRSQIFHAGLFYAIRL
jgi:hypothetical protein